MSKGFPWRIHTVVNTVTGEVIPYRDLRRQMEDRAWLHGRWLLVQKGDWVEAFFDKVARG